MQMVTRIGKLVLGGKGGNGHNTNKCRTCGSKKHKSEDCDSDMAKLSCFKCGQKGHISANCRNKGVSPQAGKAGKGKEKGEQNGKKGFKGKLNEVADNENAETEAEQDWWEWPADDKSEQTEDKKEQGVTLPSVFQFGVFETKEPDMNFGFNVEFYDEIFMIGPSCTCLNVHVSMSPDASAAILHVLRSQQGEKCGRKGFVTCEVSRIWSRDDLENLDHEKLHDMSPEKPWKCFAWTLMMLSCCAMCLQMMIKRERHCLKYGMSLLVFVIGFLIFAQPHILPGIPKEILGQVCPSSSEVGWSLGNISMPMSLLLSAVASRSFGC